MEAVFFFACRGQKIISKPAGKPTQGGRRSSVNRPENRPQAAAARLQIRSETGAVQPQISRHRRAPGLRDASNNVKNISIFDKFILTNSF
ncbi:MAG: hypothetical protein ILO53_07540 [Clostridia bacterium]|nr:hypothetical protein [Clostridia bacterium]